MTTRREFISLGNSQESDTDLCLTSAEESNRLRTSALHSLPVNTIRLSKTAMAADFEIILNPGCGRLLAVASQVFDLVDRLEDKLSIYRPHSELSRLNESLRSNLGVPMQLEPRLFELVSTCLQLAQATDGAFDPTAGPFVTLWKQCRQERRLPFEPELEAARDRIGFTKLILDSISKTLATRCRGCELNFNAIGKGYALDRLAEEFDAANLVVPTESETERDSNPTKSMSVNETLGTARHSATSLQPEESWLIHGGYSSLLARGSLAGTDGWPVSVQHPQFPHKSLATLWLKNRALSTSGISSQHFRLAGRRFGHLIDPRTGWPVEKMLSATVLAPSATEAEGLSTAFFVLGVETAERYCHNHPEISALLVPAPEPGQRCEAVSIGLSSAELMFSTDH